MTPLPRSAEPIIKGTRCPDLNSLTMSSKTLSRARLDVGDQLFHQRIVVVGEALKHGEARLLLAVELVRGQLDDARHRVLAVNKSALEREIDEASRDPVLPDGYLAKQKRCARGRLKQGERVAKPCGRGVDLVEEEDARQAHVLDLAQDHLERRRLFRIRLTDNDGRVANGEHIAHLMHELDGARAIDEGVAVTEEFRGRNIGFHAHRVGASLRARIPDARSRAHAALAGDGAGARQQSLEKRRLSALKRPDDRDEPRPGPFQVR